MSEPKTSPRRVAAKLRAAEALKLRLSGATYADIQRQLDYGTGSAVRKALDAALRDVVQEPAEAVRKMELQRLDRMALPFWLIVIAEHSTLADRRSAVDMLLRIMDRRARYLGLDAPIKIDYTRELEASLDDTDLTDDERRDALREASAIIRAAQAKANG